MTAAQFDSYNYGAAWWDLTDRYGFTAAVERVAEAARDRDLEALNAALSDARRGTTAADYSGTEQTSTWGNFWRQLTTDPLAAPLDSANNQLGNVWKKIFSSPFVLLTLAVVVFYLLGGFDYLKRKVSAA